MAYLHKTMAMMINSSPNKLSTTAANIAISYSGSVFLCSVWIFSQFGCMEILLGRDCAPSTKLLGLIALKVAAFMDTS